MDVVNAAVGPMVETEVAAREALVAVLEVETEAEAGSRSMWPCKHRRTTPALDTIPPPSCRLPSHPIRHW